MLVFLVIFSDNLFSQIKPLPEYQVKAAFLYNFTRFVNWPPVAYSSPRAPFVIGIMGPDPFGSYLRDIVKNERLGDHPITVQRILELNDIDRCHMLFINTRDTERIIEILSAVRRRNILTVSDADNFARLGGMIRFFTEDNKIRIQINASSARAAQLSISSKLLNIARVY